MRPIQSFVVTPSLPPALQPLREIAYNLRWSWTHDAIELFRRLDRDLWEASGHNPVRMLGAIGQDRLDEAAASDAFLDHLARVNVNLSAYLLGERAWFNRVCRPKQGNCSVAYFSAEFGLTECLSIFAGGLGMLAGDHLKSASDLGLPLVGVGLLYQQGYFRQYLSASGWQQETFENNDIHNLPIAPAVDSAGQPAVIRVEMPERPVFAQVWRVEVGRVPLLLLDTNIDANPRPQERNITGQLYGGDGETRLKQEMVLGIGGCRALHALGMDPHVYHMNEGHSAFLAVERVRTLMQSRSLSCWEASILASAGLVFTTHTPVEAGHDYFSADLMRRYFASYAQALGLSVDEFIDLGRVRRGEGDFCMTVLALRFSSRANGVSRLHGRVSRAMWNKMWPQVAENEVPIGYVTNGVHFPSWTSLEIKRLYDRYLGPDWREEPANGEVWHAAHTIPAEELWRTHVVRRERLVGWARKRVREQRIRRSATPREIDGADEVLNPDALTIGFARRFATYKRATLIFRDRDRLKRLLSDPDRPVQLILAGKAHPKDDAGKELIRQVTDLSRDPEWGRRIVFIEDYDMAVARYLVQGVDVWLNTPVRPNEASGTSGMKAAANGALNLSVLDGWWDEVYSDAANPQSIGWAIGRGETYSEAEYRDQVEAAALYDILERDVVPTFYDRGPDRLPRKWVDRMKGSIASLCPFVNTNRMVSQYAREMYIPAANAFEELDVENGGGARELAAWVEGTHREWSKVRVLSVDRTPGATLPVRDKARFTARVQLGSLKSDDVAVELYLGPLNSTGDIVDGVAIPMVASSDAGQDGCTFVVETSCSRSGQYGYTVRIRPTHPKLIPSLALRSVRWADEEAGKAASGSQ